jgi:ribose transport system permease protein
MTSETVPARPENEEAPGLLFRLTSFSTLWITIALLIEIAIFAVWLPTGTFLSIFNLQTVAADSAVVLMLATAATLVIITGGIDLSLGSTLTLSAVCAARVMTAVAPHSGQWAAIAGLATGVGIGLLAGLFNGYLVAYRKIPAFVVTLGTLSIALGIARLASGGVGISGAPESIRMLGQSQLFGTPTPFLIALCVIIGFGLLLDQTRFGEHTYFIGSSPEAARRGGIDVSKQTMLIYVAAGALAGAAGIVDFARFEVASVSTGHTTELIAAIAAVVIGGGSLFGGVGSLRGTAVGVFIPVILANGLLIGGIERFWQDVITGFILIIAVAFDQWRRKSESVR